MVEQSKFSIFDPVISYEHREFYEGIVNDLNAIIPVCNQGKCLAVEISRNLAEQDTIRELMGRVERFRDELLAGTKKLFDQFYQSKESFHQMIQSTVAYVKINLIDRNLLERTCDVRWWALETAFCLCIEEFNNVRADFENLSHLIGDHSHELNEKKRQLIESGGAGSSFWRALLRGPAQSGQMLSLNARIEALDKFSPLLEGVGVLVNCKKHEEFNHQMQEVCRLLEEEDSEGPGRNISDMCRRLKSKIDHLSPMIAFACGRLQAINSSYTLYRDLVICDHAGYIIASSNPQRREQILGRKVSSENWFSGALNTASGSEYFVQDLADSAVEEQPSLVYSTAIRKDGRENNPAIGAMGIFFDFQGEAGIILSDYMPNDKGGGIKEGWCSLLTNREGAVIGSSDSFSFREGTYPPIPRKHRQLQPGQTGSSYGVYCGQDAAIFSARTDGYLDYAGLGWSSHIVLPRRDIFRRHDSGLDSGVKMEELLHSSIIPEINKSTYANVQKDKRALQLISTNGMLFAAELGTRGQSLSPVFELITRTGDFATKCMEDLLCEMAVDSLNLNFQTLRLFSKQAIDLIDRNLFERSADIRWWATDRYFWEALGKPGEDSFREACERLKVINNSYTMYRNLVLADSAGNIVACARPALFNQLRGINVSGHEWYQQAMQIQSASEYVVQDVCRCELESGKKSSLVYAGAIRANGAKEGDALGVLGVLFDWDTEARKMLENCLPRDNSGESISGSAAFYTNAQGVIIETTDPESFPCGLQDGELERICSSLPEGEAASGFFQREGQRYIIGSARTKGYREYRGLSWTAHVLRPF